MNIYKIMQVLAVHHAISKFLFYFYRNIFWETAHRHTRQHTGKILTIQLLQYLKREQHQRTPECHNAVQILFMGSKIFFSILQLHHGKI